MIGCGQAAPGQNCVPNDVAMSAAIQGMFPVVDVFGHRVDVGAVVLPVLFFGLLLLG